MYCSGFLLLFSPVTAPELLQKCRSDTICAVSGVVFHQMIRHKYQRSCLMRTDAVCTSIVHLTAFIAVAAAIQKHLLRKTDCNRLIRLDRNGNPSGHFMVVIEIVIVKCCFFEFCISALNQCKPCIIGLLCDADISCDFIYRKIMILLIVTVMKRLDPFWHIFIAPQCLFMYYFIISCVKKQGADQV